MMTVMIDQDSSDFCCCCNFGSSGGKCGSCDDVQRHHLR